MAEFTLTLTNVPVECPVDGQFTAGTVVVTYDDAKRVLHAETSSVCPIDGLRPMLGGQALHVFAQQGLRATGTTELTLTTAQEQVEAQATMTGVEALLDRAMTVVAAQYPDDVSAEALTPLVAAVFTYLAAQP